MLKTNLQLSKHINCELVTLIAAYHERGLVRFGPKAIPLDPIYSTRYGFIPDLDCTVRPQVRLTVTNSS